MVIDISNTLRLPLLYTAMSIAKTAYGLFLVGESLQEIKARPQDHPLNKELQRMESEAPVVFNICSLDHLTLSGSEVKAVFHNFPYLANHSLDIEADPIYMDADILVFVETHSNNVGIKGFTLAGQLEFTGNRSYGIGAYKRDNLGIVISQHSADVISWEEAHLEYLAVHSGRTILFIVYISPNFPKNRAIDILVQLVKPLPNQFQDMVLVGDLNININSADGSKLQQNLATVGLHLSTLPQQSSNDYKNQIDLVFSTIGLTFCQYSESLLSDHKPIHFSFPLQ